MNRFRYWLADLISGGDLTRLKLIAHVFSISECDTVIQCNETLRQIAAEVKPTSNATVKRMGRIAEESLK